MIDDLLRDPSACEGSSHPTVFRRLLNPDISRGQTLPSREALIQEAMGFVMAGSIELSNALAYGTFHVLKNPGVNRKLFEELTSVWPDPNKSVRFDVLEKLPYLVNNLNLLD